MKEIEQDPSGYRVQRRGTPAYQRWLWGSVLIAVAAFFLFAYTLNGWFLALIVVCAFVAGINYARLSGSEPLFAFGGLSRLIGTLLGFAIIFALAIVMSPLFHAFHDIRCAYWFTESCQH